MASPPPSPGGSPELPILVPPPAYVPFPAILIDLTSDEPAEPALAAADGDGDGGEQGNNAFAPSDQELLWDYLGRRVLEQPIPLNFIIETDLYKVDPGELPRNYPNNDEGGCRYFFSRLEMRKYGEGNRSSRTTPGGRWRARNKEWPVTDDNGMLIGFKRTLDFCREKKISEQQMTEWTMEEFRLNTDLEPFKNHNNDEVMVLCKVSKKTNRRSDAKQAEEDQEEVDI